MISVRADGSVYRKAVGGDRPAACQGRPGHNPEVRHAPVHRVVIPAFVIIPEVSRPLISGRGVGFPQLETILTTAPHSSGLKRSAIDHPEHAAVHIHVAPKAGIHVQYAIPGELDNGAPPVRNIQGIPHVAGYTVVVIYDAILPPGPGVDGVVKVQVLAAGYPQFRVLVHEDRIGRTCGVGGNSQHPQGSPLVEIRYVILVPLKGDDSLGGIKMDKTRLVRSLIRRRVVPRPRIAQEPPAVNVDSPAAVRGLHIVILKERIALDGQLGGLHIGHHVDGPAFNPRGIFAEIGLRRQIEYLPPVKFILSLDDTGGVIASNSAQPRKRLPFHILHDAAAELVRGVLGNGQGPQVIQV